MQRIDTIDKFNDKVEVQVSAGGISFLVYPKPLGVPIACLTAEDAVRIRDALLAQFPLPVETVEAVGKRYAIVRQRKNSKKPGKLKLVFSQGGTGDKRVFATRKDAEDVLARILVNYGAESRYAIVELPPEYTV